MSPRAAWRLTSLGFDAYDYVAGKADWLAFGLPHEGSARFAGSVVTDDVATCALGARLGDVREALSASPAGTAVVLDGNGVVMGRLYRGALEADDDVPVAELMREGPTTIRPSEELGPLVERMTRAEVDAIVVTTPDGRLVGLLERDRAAAAVAGA